MGDKVGMRLDQPAYYRICVQGAVDAHWLHEYFDLRTELISGAELPDVTVLAGELVDQSALVGVLRLIHDSGLPLLALECFPYDADAAS